TLLLREPGGTPAGERLRDLLKDATVELTPLAELMLFCAARAELVERVIEPAIDAGRNVVCDRFVDSTGAYQGEARGIEGAPAHSHSYVSVGPTGGGTHAVARRLAATLLADRADDPADAGRRALMAPSPHPDLTWLRPPGNQHLVQEVRREVIGALAYRPFQ